MDTIEIAAKTRKTKTDGELSQLRKSGRIPAVVYGLEEEPKTVDVDENELNKCLRMENKNQIIQLNIEGQQDLVILKEITRHPIQHNKILHLDFLRVNETKPVTVKVPIKHSGTPIGVKSEGGQFLIMKRFVVVKCKVNDIPEAFIQDISELSLDTIVCAGDLSFPQGTILTPAKTALYGVITSRVIEEELPAEEEEKEGEEGAEPEEGKEKAEGAEDSDAAKEKESKESDKSGEKQGKSKKEKS